MMQSFPQFGEAVLLWQYFQEMPQGFFVEVGANQRTKFSQTWLLERRLAQYRRPPNLSEPGSPGP